MLDKTLIQWFIEPSIKRNMSPIKLDSRFSPIIRRTLIANEKLKEILSKDHSYEDYDVFFLTFTNYLGKEIKYIGKIVDELKNRNIKCSLLIFDPLSKLSISKLRSSENMIYSYIKYVDKEDVKKRAQKISKTYKKLNDERKIYYSFEMIYLLILYYETVKIALKKHRTKLVFVTGDLSIIERCVIAAADSCNVKILLNPIGLGFGITDYHNLDNLYMAAFGNDHKKMLLANGVKKDHIFLTGSIMFDKIGSYVRSKNALHQNRTDSSKTA